MTDTQPAEKTVQPKVNTEVKDTKEVVEEVKPVVDDFNPPKPEEDLSLFVLSNDDYLTDPFFHEVSNYFDLERKEYGEAAPKIAGIVEYLVDTYKITDEAGVFRYLSKLERSLPPTVPGEKRYRNLYKYCKLANEKSMHDKKSTALDETLKEMTNSRA